MRILTVATRNAHKIGELAAIFGPEWLLQDFSSFRDIPEPEETGGTFQENAAIKAIAGSHVVPGLVLADDSGLEVDLLNGAPGVRSARYAGEKATDSQNRAHLLAEIALCSHPADKPMSARFRCAMAIARSGKILATFSGSVQGRITLTESGSGGFGYDSLFIPSGYRETFAEMNAGTKNILSHRANAARQALEWLGRQAEELFGMEHL